MPQPNQDSLPLDQRSGDPGGGATAVSTAAAQPLLSEVEAAALEFSKKIVSLFFQLKQHSIPNADNQDSISMTTIDPETPPMLSEAKEAAQDFLKGREHEYYRSLYNAAIEGDWKTAKRFIERDASASTARITSQSLTTLMVAARACQWKFVQKLLEELPSESLAAVDVFGRTALHYTALGGSLKTAKALIRKNSALPQIQDNDGLCPLMYGLFTSKEMFWYLVLVTRDEQPSLPFTGPQSALLVAYLINSGYYDTTLYLLGRYPELAFVKFGGEGLHLLGWLSNQSQDFLSGSNLSFWKRWIYKWIRVKVSSHSIWVNRKDFLGNSEDSPNMVALVQPSSILTQVFKWLNTFLWKAVEQLAAPLKQIRDEKMKHLYAVELVNHVCTLLSISKTWEQTIQFFTSPQILAIAASQGTVEMISTCLQYFPDLIWISQTNLLHNAIANRQAKLFKFLQEMPTILAILNIDMDVESNTTLHLAAKLAPSSQLLSVSGAAFQMQRELQWFKEVEKISPRYRQNMPNNDGLMPKELFKKEHKELAKEGETWMKNTSNSGMIVATLIATVVLAAAFTVPGGNNDKGIPNFLHKSSFLIFVVSDALALFSSVTSLFMFLSILTARYEDKDFHRALPKRLIIGLGSLFFAIATMMAAFGATLSIVLSERWEWAYIPIILLASIPVTIFAMLQLPLFFQMINSTYGSDIFSS